MHLNTKLPDGTDLVTYLELVQTQEKGFVERIHWFQDKCAKLGVYWNEGHMQMLRSHVTGKIKIGNLLDLQK